MALGDDGGTYLVGGQIFHDYNEALAAENALNTQMANGGDAILRDPQPGGTQTPEVQQQIAVEQQAAASAGAATATSDIGALGFLSALSPLDLALLGLGGILLVRMFRHPRHPSPH